MSKLISRLPRAIKKRALECMKEQNVEYEPQYDLKHGFVWDKTKEDYSIWADVHNGHYSSFYTFHNIEPTKRGRPKKYKEKTTTRAYRMPESKVEIIDKMVYSKLKEYELER